MSRKLIALNLALVALAATLGWQARKRYLEMKAHEREILDRSVRAQPVIPPPAAQLPAPVTAVQYGEVAQKTLFSKDRNPTVVVEAPPPKPEPPMPALPLYYGQMAIGDPVVFLSVRGGDQKRFHAGEKAGDFQIVSFDREKIVFAWNDKQIEKKIADLSAKSDQGQPQASSQSQTSNAQPAPAGAHGVRPTGPPPSAPTGATGAQVRSLGSADSSAESPVGREISGTDFRACSMSDPTPEGKVVDGYRKVVTNTLF